MICGDFEFMIIELGDLESVSNIEIWCDVKLCGCVGMIILEIIEEGIEV